MNINLNGNTAVDLLPLMSMLRSCCRKQYYATVSVYLETLNLEECSITVLISVMRTTYAFSKYIVSWKPTLHRVCAELDSRGRNGAKLLHGLYTEYNNPFAAEFPGLFDNEHLHNKES